MWVYVQLINKVLIDLKDESKTYPEVISIFYGE